MKFAKVLVLAVAAVSSVAPAQYGRPANTYPADVPVSWMTLMYDRVKGDALSPPVASRRFGIAGVALYESIIPGMAGHQSLGGQLNQLGVLAAPSPANYSWPTVANAAMARTMSGLFASSAPSMAAITALEAQNQLALNKAVNAATTTRSIARGQAIADTILAWAATDGFSIFNNCAYVVPTGPGFWVPTPPAFAPNPLQPCWGQLRTFAVASGSSCAPVAPPAYSTTPGSDFHNLALEVYNTSLNLTAEQNLIANFWADGAGATGTPPGHWISVTSQILAANRMSLAKAAEAYAKVGIGVADAFICCWNAKYQHNVMRPVTYIRANINPTWSSLIGTPPFPEYTSGYSTQSGAAAVLMTSAFGNIVFTDNTHGIHNPALNFAPRSYTSFYQAATEAAVSRLYGGIHYSSGNNEGLAQGNCLGQTILTTINF